MLIGVPTEIKTHEYRVGMTPSSVRELTLRGHKVLVQRGAGRQIGFTDELYAAHGAEVVESGEDVYARAKMIVKVKEPQASEYRLLHDDQILFTYLHLAPDRTQTRALLASGCTAIAYETVTDERGALPLLAPMSDVAGRLAVQAGAQCLQLENDGAGILLGGVPGVAPASVVILGGGVVGTSAARIAIGMGAQVTIIDRSLRRLNELELYFGSRVKTAVATTATIEESVLGADLVIGAVLLPGATAPKLVTEAMVRRMKPGSVLVDVAIDQGGCFETSRPTTHASPTFKVHDVVHYCVANMPGAVARTSTLALNNATLPFILALATHGLGKALADDLHLRNGLNVIDGKITHPAVAEAMNASCYAPERWARKPARDA